MHHVYENIGKTYRSTRREDPQLAEAIWSALQGATSVVNVGAGAGSYEPRGPNVLAVEPSGAMIRQRPPDAAPAIQACAEALPLKNDSFDAVLAVNTLHHWSEIRTGLRESRRVARYRVVIFHRDPTEGAALWLTERYFPTLLSSARMAAIRSRVAEEFGSVESIAVPLPAGCQDGLFSAYWARPEAYLDASIRRNISNFALADSGVVAAGLELLRKDLESGEWDREFGHLRRRMSLDLGHRILIASL